MGHIFESCHVVTFFVEALFMTISCKGPPVRWHWLACPIFSISDRQVMLYTRWNMYSWLQTHLAFIDSLHLQIEYEPYEFEEARHSRKIVVINQWVCWLEMRSIWLSSKNIIIIIIIINIIIIIIIIVVVVIIIIIIIIIIITSPQKILDDGFKYLFHHYLGKTPMLTNIFQWGWSNPTARDHSDRNMFHLHISVMFIYDSVHVFV